MQFAAPTSTPTAGRAARSRRGCWRRQGTGWPPADWGRAGPGRIPGPLVDSVRYGRTSQKVSVAIARAFLLSADVPGVKLPLSPAVLKDAACCWAVLIALWLPPQ